MNRALAFIFDKHSKQSIASLIGTLEADERFRELCIVLLKPGPDLAERIEALALRHDWIGVGFSFTTPRAPDVFDVVQQVRQGLPARARAKTTLIAGGPHPSGDWRQTLAMGFDVVVVGEGERSFPALLLALWEGGSLRHIRGLAYRGDGQACFTGRAEHVQDLDDCPPFAARFGLFSSIEITRGCPWACRFCQTSFLFGAHMRHRSVDNIIRWVEMSRQLDRPEIRFVTPDAFAYGSEGGQPRLDRLAEMLRTVNQIVGRDHTYLGSFPSEVRPESVSPEAVELVRAYAANDNLVIGAQSGSQRMLDLAHRGHTVEDIYRAVRLTIEAGLTANVDLIFGMPGETEKDQQATLKVMQDLAALGARIHSHAFMPLAGTPWARSQPGVVDSQTECLLENLAGRGQHFGQWRQQQRAWQAAAGLRASLSGES